MFASQPAAGAGRACQRSRPPSSGRAFTSACGATARSFSSGAPRAKCPRSAWSSRSSRPGLIVVKHRSEPFGKFVNVAVLEGDQIKIVDEGIRKILPDCPALVTSLAGAIDHRVGIGCHRGSDPAGGIDAAARPRRRAARRADRHRCLARIDRDAGALRRRSAVFGTVGTGAPQECRPRRLETRGRCDRRPDRRGWRDHHQRSLRSAGVRGKDRAAPRQHAGRSGECDRAGRRQCGRHMPRRRNWAARAISPPRNSCTISTTPWRWSPRRTAASRSSSGRRANSSSTRIASMRCCCKSVVPTKVLRRFCVGGKIPLFERQHLFGHRAAPSGSAAARIRAAAPCLRSSAGR